MTGIKQSITSLKLQNNMNEFERLRRNILINLGGGEVIPSYLIKTDDTRIDFKLDNTPINNFLSTGSSSSYITVNGQSITKDSVREIVFGDSYKNYTSLGNSFLRNFSELISADFSIFKLTSVGNYFLSTNVKLASINIPNFNLISAGTNFLYYSNSLKSIQIGAWDWSDTVIGANFFTLVRNFSTCNLYANTLEIGNKFKDKFSPRLSNWTVVVN